MSQAEETLTTDNTLSRGEKLRTQLQHTNALHTDGKWVRGTVENIRVRPTVQIKG